ncbi:hypothetical protein VZT92_022559 [Zoarces viviparus]|uniref:Uncharacterized protein n=1 Tax=Zoarces viviparus TaxID=48416 RepID=A0AAW1EBQ5_ZOAVI
MAVVHCMMTAFTAPPPPLTSRVQEVKVAAAFYGLLTEILQIKSLSSGRSRLIGGENGRKKKSGCLSFL